MSTALGDRYRAVRAHTEALCRPLPLEDYVVLGGQVGIVDHLTIGEGAQVASQSGIMSNIPAGERWGGYPAQRLKGWMREVAALRKLSRQSRGGKTEGPDE